MNKIDIILQLVQFIWSWSFFIFFFFQAEYLYVNEFAGGWSWDYGMEFDDAQDADCLTGMAQLEGRTDHGVVDVTIA